jgi:hypothetical protein
MYGVISPAPDSFTSPFMCQYVACACESQMFRLAVRGTCTFLLSFLKIKVLSVQKQN